jgi:PAS domain-containing protein
VTDETWVSQKRRSLSSIRRALLDASLDGDTQRVLSLGCRAWATTLGLRSAWVASLSDDGESLMVVASYRVPESLLVESERLLASALATSQAFAAGRPLVLRDAEEWAGLTSGSILLAPLSTHGARLGVIAGDWRGAPAHQGDGLVALAEELSASIEMSVASARRIEEMKATTQVLERRLRELEGLMDAGQRDRRMAEESMDLMRRATARLHAIIDQMPQGVAVARAPDGALVMANPIAARILRPDATGRLTSRVLKGDGAQYPPNEWPLTRALRGEMPPPEVVLITGADDRRSTVLMRAVPIQDPDGRVAEALIILQDIA